MLIRSPYDSHFYLISFKNNKPDFNEWVEIKKDQTIIVLEEHDLTHAVASAATAAAVGAALAAGWGAAAWEAAWTKAEKEIKATGKIKGYVTIVGDKLVWLSHYDFDALTNFVNNQNSARTTG
jgi:hypothetical protein